MLRGDWCFRLIGGGRFYETKQLTAALSRIRFCQVSVWWIACMAALRVFYIWILWCRACMPRRLCPTIGSKLLRGKRAPLSASVSLCPAPDVLCSEMSVLGFIQRLPYHVLRRLSVSLRGIEGVEVVAGEWIPLFRPLSHQQYCMSVGRICGCCMVSISRFICVTSSLLCRGDDRYPP